MENNWCTLVIENNNMTATMSLKSTNDDNVAFITPSFIEQFLIDQGIKYGICRAGIESLLHPIRYDCHVVVAEGTPAINGADGHTEFLIPVEDSKKPIISQDGSVDYFNSLKLALVEENQLIAQYIPPTTGEGGMDIFSSAVMPVPGKEIPPIRGKGFTYDENTGEYRASYSGHISFINNKLTIDKLYLVTGDLDIDVGSINFNGDVEVMGDVRSGFSINAEGSVYIHGHVGACQIASKQSVIISKGVQGRDRCVIVADGDVTCKFVERCRIVAKGNVFADSILNSEVSARGQVNVTSRTGVVIGGNVTGMMGVTVKTAGNETGVATLISTGPSSADIQKIIDLTEKAKKAEDELRLVEAKLSKISAIPPADRSAQVKELFQKLLKAKIVVATDKKKIVDELLPLNEFVNTASAECFIHVTGVSYAGVSIKIGKTNLFVTESFKDVTYTLRNGVIEANGS